MNNDETVAVKALDTDPENVLTADDYRAVFGGDWPRIVELICEKLRSVGGVCYVAFGYDDPRWEGDWNDPVKTEGEGKVENLDLWRVEIFPKMILIAPYGNSGGPTVIRFDREWLR